MANWSYNTPVGQQGSTVVGGGGTPLAGFRNIVDARRAMAIPKIPQAEYADGYLGSYTDRRGDKLLQTVRNNARSYTRGVHKGSRIEPEDYYWPDDFNPMSGLEAQKRGKKWTAQGSPVERLVYGDKYMSQAEAAQFRQELNLPVDPQMQSVDVNVRAGMRRNLPGWR